MQYVHAHGADIPVIGFGTFELARDTCREMVAEALELGYRHIDTAQAYGNEDAVGQALQASSIHRDDVFVTTKVWPDNYRHADLQQSVAASLERLGLDQVDLLLLHWPNPEVPLQETLSALNAVKDAGQTRHIGVSNFPTRELREAVALSDAPLVTNQLEYHPFLNQDTELAELTRHDMALTAYAPLAQGQVPGNDELADIGRRHGKSAAQAGLRWLIQQPGVAAIPRSSSARHAAANLEVLDFELSPEEMQRVGDLARADGRVINPAHLAPEWD